MSGWQLFYLYTPWYHEATLSHHFVVCRFEEVAGVRSSAVKAAMRCADAALESLSPGERSAVAESRQKGEAVIQRVVTALTDELGAYQQGSLLTKVQRWDADGVALIGPLH